MVELKRDGLVFSFPEVHPDATLTIGFQRTLRIPDDDRDHPLPPGLGRFPLRHVDDFGARVPERWRTHGGVFLPMYQSEAMWLNFGSGGAAGWGGFHVRSSYPMAVKIAAGKINAVSGEDWTDGLHRDPQDYLVVPGQPWLDGYCVEKGLIRQFVAMPLGSGYSAEEQLTGRAEHGGVQIVVHPLKREVWERMERERRRQERALVRMAEPSASIHMDLCASPAPPDMGLAPGGRMRQEIYDDPHAFEEWDLRHRGRCFVHVANSLVWRAITGEDPPTTPPTAAEYTRAGLPWFDWYDGDREALEGAPRFRGMKSVAEKGKEKGDRPLPENESVEVKDPVRLGPKRSKDQVREGRF